MAFYDGFLDQMENKDQRIKVQQVLNWVSDKYPQLGGKIAWKQPMFTDHGTFILAFSIAKNNFAFAPEPVAMEKFADEIEKSGYSHTKNIVRIPYDAEVNYELIAKIIDFNIEDKKEYTSFWRK